MVQCEGGSDDLDVPIDALFHDAAARSEFNLGSLNSVNVVRLLMQVSSSLLPHDSVNVPFTVIRFLMTWLVHQHSAPLVR